MDTDKKIIKLFKGLNNVSETYRLSPEWFIQADNVDISKTFGVERCDGFVRRTTNSNVTGAYATEDQKRLYLVTNGEIRRMNADMTYVVVKTGLSTTLPVSFDEVNGVVYYTNGVDFGCLEPTGWRPWGISSPSSAPAVSFSSGGSLPSGTYGVYVTHVDDRGMESSNNREEVVLTGSGQLSITDIPQKAGYTTNVYVTQANGTIHFLLKEVAGTSVSYTNQDVLGRELPFVNLDTPRGDTVAVCNGKIWVSEPFPQYDYTVVWSSLPLQYHHFDYSTWGLVVPGIGRMLEVTGDTLVVGTDRQIFAYDEEKLVELADYGVVDGFHGAMIGDSLFFWSLRGLCSVMPFKNLTESKLSVAPGSSASAAVLEKDGMRRYVVALQQNGQPYNRR